MMGMRKSSAELRSKLQKALLAKMLGETSWYIESPMLQKTVETLRMAQVTSAIIPNASIQSILSTSRWIQTTDVRGVWGKFAVHSQDISSLIFASTHLPAFFPAPKISIAAAHAVLSNTRNPPPPLRLPSQIPLQMNPLKNVGRRSRLLYCHPLLLNCRLYLWTICYRHYRHLPPNQCVVLVNQENYSPISAVHPLSIPRSKDFLPSIRLCCRVPALRLKVLKILLMMMWSVERRRMMLNESSVALLCFTYPSQTAACLLAIFRQRGWNSINI